MPAAAKKDHTNHKMTSYLQSNFNTHLDMDMSHVNILQSTASWNFLSDEEFVRAQNKILAEFPQQTDKVLPQN